MKNVRGIKRFHIAAILGLVVGLVLSCGLPFGDTASALSVPTVVVSPNVVGETAGYVIRFVLGAALEPGQTIYLTFPKGTHLPCTSCNPRILQTTLSVNGVHPVQPSIGNASTGLVQIFVPEHLGAGQEITVVVDASAQVRNPVDDGIYSIDVSTSAEPVPVASAGFRVGRSQVVDPVVLPESSILGVRTGYTLTFTTGPLGAIVAGRDSITITFPDEFTLPAALVASTVSVNGVAVVEEIEQLPGRKAVVITSPITVGEKQAVKVVLTSAFGLSNPVVRGEYRLYIRTTTDEGDVASEPFAILDKPSATAVIAVMPPVPDGQNLWYLQEPLVALQGQTNMPGAVVVLYGIDGEPITEYAKPFSMPEGVHTLRYRASNPTADVTEDAVHEYTFKVEATSPSVTISGGLSPRLVSRNPFLLEGSVSSSSPVVGVEVAGVPAPVSTLGRFSADLLLSEGTNDIPVAVRTEAGHAIVETLRITLDSTPPKLTVTSHQNWQEVVGSDIVLKGTVEIGTHLTYLGQTIESSATDGSFTVPVSLKLGENQITLVATDAAGNRRQLSLILYSRHVSGTARTITLTIGSPAMTINGTTMALDTDPLVVPVIQLGRTLLPIRSIVQALGGQAVWDAKTQRVTLTVGTHKIVLTVGKSAAIVDGKSVSIDAADTRVVPLVLRGRTMVPFRFVIESLGGSVQWDGTLKRVTIIYPKS